MQDRSRFSYIGGGRPQQPAASAPAPADSSTTGKPQAAKKPHRNFLVRRWWLLLIIAAVVLLLGWLAYGYITTRAELQKSKTANSQQEILAQIGKHLELPQEEPAVATVNDANKLKSQEFFKNAQNGDKVFIFPKANKALIYRPSTQKVIEYSKVNLDGLNQPVQ